MATLYERYTTGMDTVLYVRGDLVGGQGFTIGTTGPNETHTITSITIKAYREGSPGTVTVEIWEADGNQHPTGSVLSSGTTNGNTFTTDTNGEERNIQLSAATLQKGTQYIVTVKAPSGYYLNWLAWSVDDSSSTYSGGFLTYSTDGGSSWVDESDTDAYFKEYGTAWHAPVAPPTALLGTKQRDKVNKISNY